MSPEIFQVPLHSPSSPFSSSDLPSLDYECSVNCWSNHTYSKLIKIGHWSKDLFHCYGRLPPLCLLIIPPSKLPRIKACLGTALAPFSFGNSSLLMTKEASSAHLALPRLSCRKASVTVALIFPRPCRCCTTDQLIQLPSKLGRYR